MELYFRNPISALNFYFSEPIADASSSQVVDVEALFPDIISVATSSLNMTGTRVVQFAKSLW